MDLLIGDTVECWVDGMIRTGTIFNIVYSGAQIDYYHVEINDRRGISVRMVHPDHIVE